MPAERLGNFHSFKSFLYFLLDQGLILFIVSPAAIMVWRGSWKLVDEFLFPEDLFLSACVSTCLGYGFIILTFLFIECKNKDWRLFERHLEWRIFMYPLSISVLLAWRGCWMLSDLYFPTNGVSLLSTHVVSFVILSITKTVSNPMFIPSFFASDAVITPFQIGTAFGTANSKVSPLYKVLDYAFTMTVVTLSTITFWRSTWMTINVYVFPQYPVFSNIISIIAAYTILISFKLVDGTLKSLVPRSSKAVVFIFQAGFCYCMAFAAIGLWRGSWQLVDIFAFPDHPITVGFISHGLGMLILCISGAVTNLIGCPCGARADSLESLSAFDTTVGTIITCPPPEEGTKSDLEMGVKKQLIVTSSSDVVTTTLLRIEKNIKG